MANQGKTSLKITLARASGCTTNVTLNNVKPEQEEQIDRLIYFLSFGVWPEGEKSKQAS